MQDSWILIDTETTGFKPPIFTVEIAAQRMKGWIPDGPSFSALVNQNVDIPSEASRVHGYTREILDRDGLPAKEVYKQFKDYAEDLPLVSYNSEYDIENVLIPEWERLKIPSIGSIGFCALKLTQRLLDPVPAGNCKLQTLRQFYNLPSRGAHTALGDVETVIDLIKTILLPRISLADFRSITDVKSFCDAEWYPSRIQFGKFKGRLLSEAKHDSEFRGWLEWLSESDKAYSRRMGSWYLAKLSQPDNQREATDLDASDSESHSRELVTDQPQVEALEAQIDDARERLASLEADLQHTSNSIGRMQNELFIKLKDAYFLRNSARDRLNYRRRFLETLIREGEDIAEEVTKEYSDYTRHQEEAFSTSTEEALSKQAEAPADQQKIKKIWRKLVGVFHPDRYSRSGQDSCKKFHESTLTL